jgi:hypothetical protein
MSQISWQDLSRRQSPLDDSIPRCRLTILLSFHVEQGSCSGSTAIKRAFFGGRGEGCKIAVCARLIQSTIKPVDPRYKGL